VRELENALTRAAALSTNGLITLDCLPPHIARDFAAEAGSRDQTPPNPLSNLALDWPTMEELERRYLALALEKVQGNRQRAADLLGLSRRTVQRLIVRYNLNALADDEAAEANDQEEGTE
jgi:two-component system NtrC family response regulator